MGGYAEIISKVNFGRRGILIFVTLGTQKFQMNRLIEAVDRLAPKLDEEVFIQMGHSTQIPQNCQYSAFISTEQFNSMVQECSLLITHAGVGTIMTAIVNEKPIIVVPRLKQYNEHVDDHQREIAQAFATKGCILNCEDVDKLEIYIDEGKKYKFQDYQVHGGNIEEIIVSFMQLFNPVSTVQDGTKLK